MLVGNGPWLSGNAAVEAAEAPRGGQAHEAEPEPEGADLARRGQRADRMTSSPIIQANATTPIA